MIGLTTFDVRAAAAVLEKAGVPSSRHDAERLAEFATNETQYAEYVARRAAREPLQHITGVAYFRYLELAVGPGVFIPRPETELVAQAAIDASKALSDAIVVDLCAGSGAIAISVASEVPTSTVYAVEIDQGALPWLERNAKGTTVRVRQGDAATALPELDGTVDVVVSNPPYVPLGMGIEMQAEVRDYDPAASLWGGQDGLDVIKQVIDRAAQLLKPGGVLVVEHDDTHGESVPALLRAPGLWQGITDHDDLTGRARFATATRSTA